ncbi:hypothetical protein P8C59_007997 [Phyllachora maydis]|uniref:Amidase domain-containing protein n=1 Tax=Phyllachora maydis TaxID=1825666 RepID=A0AAD9IAX2_9PEZI|nr:hypothetical protein P8C59_007997 [Phyllachora maydis]
MGYVSEDLSADRIRPVTALSEDELLSPDLDQRLALFDQVDDVFCPEFGGIIISTGNSSAGEHASSAGQHRSSRINLADRAAEVFSLCPMARGNTLPSGPYLLLGKELHKALRMYPDTQDAFVFGVIPDSLAQPECFHAASTVCPLGTSKTVPVPSRLYTLQRSAAQPLAGLRLAIGDQFDLKGVPATQGSKAWTELYGPGAGTAGYVRRLIALGVVIVGKTKTSQFGLGTDWVDVHRPANPRADGYRNVGTSTAGAAAAMAAYDWLDFAVGAECHIDFLRAAAENGVYSLRCLLEPASETGVAGIPRSCGLLGRELQTVQLAATQEQDTLNRRLVRAFEERMGTTGDNVRLSDLWRKSRPPVYEDWDLMTYLDSTAETAFHYEHYRRYADFRQSYYQAFQRRVYQESAVKNAWLDRKCVGSHCKMSPSWGLCVEDCIHVLDVPVLVVPFAQVLCNSEESGREEPLPLCALLVGSLGDDVRLTELAREALGQAKLPRSVTAGRNPASAPRPRVS